MTSIPASDTIVLITGANQGLGYECVKKLAAEQPDYHIILCSRDLSKGEAATKTITNLARNTSVETLDLDVTSDESIEKAAKYVEVKYGRLDVLFNNAAISRADEPTLRAEMLKVIDTNAVGAAIVTEAFIPLLRRAEVPRLLFMSSGLGSITYTLLPFFPYYGLDGKPYLTSKAAMNMIGAQYAVKHGKEGFKVNMIDPGFRATNLNGYHEAAGKPIDGATEACRLIIDSTKDGQHGTFTSTEIIHPW